MADPAPKASIGIQNPSPPRHHTEPTTPPIKPGPIGEPATLPPAPPKPSRDGQAIIDELRLIRTAIEASKKSRQRDVAVGVFFGIITLYLLAWLIGAGLRDISVLIVGSP